VAIRKESSEGKDKGRGEDIEVASNCGGEALSYHWKRKILHLKKGNDSQREGYLPLSKKRGGSFTGEERVRTGRTFRRKNYVSESLSYEGSTTEEKFFFTKKKRSNP